MITISSLLKAAGVCLTPAAFLLLCESYRLCRQRSPERFRFKQMKRSERVKGKLKNADKRRADGMSAFTVCRASDAKESIFRASFDACEYHALLGLPHTCGFAGDSDCFAKKRLPIRGFLPCFTEQPALPQECPIGDFLRNASVCSSFHGFGQK